MGTTSTSSSHGYFGTGGCIWGAAAAPDSKHDISILEKGSLSHPEPSEGLEFVPVYEGDSLRSVANGLGVSIFQEASLLTETTEVPKGVAVS